MAFRRLMLPIAAFFFAGVLFGRAAVPEEEPELSKEKATEEAVASALEEGEAALQALLGPQVQALDEMLKPMIRQIAQKYGASETELALVAKGVMEKLSSMDLNTLQALITQLAGKGPAGLEESPLLTDLIDQLGVTEEQDQL